MILSVVSAVLILSLPSGLSTLIGAILAFFLSRCTQAVSVGISFTAGIMILISFFKLIPVLPMSFNNQKRF
jgi:zinc transporter ZupT